MSNLTGPGSGDLGAGSALDDSGDPHIGPGWDGSGDLGAGPGWDGSGLWAPPRRTGLRRLCSTGRTSKVKLVSPPESGENTGFVLGSGGTSGGLGPGVATGVESVDVPGVGTTHALDLRDVPDLRPSARDDRGVHGVLPT